MLEVLNSDQEKKKVESVPQSIYQKKKKKKIQMHWRFESINKKHKVEDWDHLQAFLLPRANW
jgi:hypothetical protein